MTKIFNQVLNILKTTGYRCHIESKYISPIGWRIDIKYGFADKYIITVLPDKWVFYRPVQGIDSPIKSHTYESTIYSPEFTDALYKMCEDKFR